MQISCNCQTSSEFLEEIINGTKVLKDLELAVVGNSTNLEIL